jgi:hypothetical protein
MILIAFRRPKNHFWNFFVFDHFVTPFPSNMGVFVPFPVCLISLSFRTFHPSIPGKNTTIFFLLLIDVTKWSKQKWSKINRKSNLFFKNLIFDDFYTDDPLAEIIGREMIVWQDCIYRFVKMVSIVRNVMKQWRWKRKIFLPISMRIISQKLKVRASPGYLPRTSFKCWSKSSSTF